MPQYEGSMENVPEMEVSGSKWANDIQRIRHEVGEEATRTTDVNEAHGEAYKVYDEATVKAAEAQRSEQDDVTDRAAA